ncbi:TPA: Mor transcription activator family protein [Salmonella enterica]
MSITTQEKLMSGIREAAFSVLSRHGFSAAIADKISIAIVKQLSFAWEGNVIYITRTPDHDVMWRNQRIFDEFRGANHDVLAEKYGVSIQWIYSIVKGMRAEYIKQRQPDMFNYEEPDDEDVSEFIRAQFKTLGDIMDHSAWCLRQQVPDMTESRALSLGKEIAYLTSELRKGQSAHIRKEKNVSDEAQADMFGDG